MIIKEVSEALDRKCDEEGRKPGFKETVMKGKYRISLRMGMWSRTASRSLVG